MNNGYILYICGAPDGTIARLLGITEGAVAKRRVQKWRFGRA